MRIREKNDAQTQTIQVKLSCETARQRHCEIEVILENTTVCSTSAGGRGIVLYINYDVFMEIALYGGGRTLVPPPPPLQTAAVHKCVITDKRVTRI